MKKEKKVEKKNLTIGVVGCNVLIELYDENPYRPKKTESGLILPSTVTEFNPDSGKRQAAEEGIMCGVVLEVGSDVKTLKIGDDVFVFKPVCRPIDFLGNTIYQTNEPNIICFVRDEK